MFPPKNLHSQEFLINFFLRKDDFWGHHSPRFKTYLLARYTMIIGCAKKRLEALRTRQVQVHIFLLVISTTLFRSHLYFYRR
jgi:hypothetical protein